MYYKFYFKFLTIQINYICELKCISISLKSCKYEVNNELVIVYNELFRI